MGAFSVRGRRVSARRVIATKAAASTEENAVPIAVALGLPVAAVAASSALISSGAISPAGIDVRCEGRGVERTESSYFLQRSRLWLEMGCPAARSAPCSDSHICTQAYFHSTAGFVFDANAAGQVPECVGLRQADFLVAYLCHRHRLA